MSMQPIISFTDLADKYDAFIIDLWGVMHDGTTLYPGATSALAYLHEQKKPVLFLSNAPRKTEKAEMVLDRLGVPRAHYNHLLTSGQATYNMLSTSDHWGKHYYYLGPGKDEDVLSGLDYVRVDDPEAADFVLNAGFEVDFQPEEEVHPALEQLLACKLPLLCINPDLEVVKLDGTRMLCAGWVAERYESMGGTVSYVGKPYPLVYERSLGLLDIDETSKNRVLAIGDNLLTDIKGANRVNIDSLLITGGILKNGHGELPDTARLTTLCDKAEATPTYIAEHFAV